MQRAGHAAITPRPALASQSRGDPELAELQARLLRVAAGATRPGGTLVYSVCTISRREGPELIEAFLDSEREWEAEPLAARYPQWRDRPEGRFLQLLPHRDGTDGFFIARLRRSGTLP